MTLLEFIEEYKDSIDSYIRNIVPEANIDNRERELWIMNDHSLYTWAAVSGVKDI